MTVWVLIRVVIVLQSDNNLRESYTIYEFIFLNRFFVNKFMTINIYLDTLREIRGLNLKIREKRENKTLNLDSF